MTSQEIFKNRKVQLMLGVVAICLLILVAKGPSFGVDFAGGTLFQIHLADKIDDSAQKDNVRMIIQQRLDFSGLKDSSVQVIGNQLVFAQLAETDPKQIERIESVLLKQGKFEAMITSPETGEGMQIFSGEDFVNISKDPAKGYGVSGTGTSYGWTLPFTLNEKAAKSFTEKTFHRCSRTGFDSAQNKPTYECDKTYFFLDRPVTSIIVMPQELFDSEKEALSAGVRSKNIPADTSIDEMLAVSNIPFIIVDENKGFSSEQLEMLGSLGEKRFAIVPSVFSRQLKDQIKEKGFTLSEIVVPEETPWIWVATGVKEIISLTEDVTNEDAASINDPELETFSSLIIRGGATTKDEANNELKSLAILLESGSLPVSVDSISKVSVTPSLGKSFLLNVALIAFIASLVVAIILFLRYRFVWLVIPMIFTMFAEAMVTLGIASLLGWPLDLAALAGLIAAIGYGVDDQIVITDELKKRRGDVSESVSLLNRAKRAFFIVMAAAATVIATMLPLLVLGPSFGMARLVGFAFTTIIGVLAGVLITRPAFQEIAKYVISKKQGSE